MKADSDHQPFFAAGVPVLMLHTGLHEDYHRPSDKADKINSAGLKSVSQLLFSTALDLADSPDKPKFRTASRDESPDTEPVVEQLSPVPAGRLGITWNEAQAKQDIVQVAAVTPGSPADKAGLKVDDRIVEYAGRNITDIAQLRELVLATRGLVPIQVARSVTAANKPAATDKPAEPLKLQIQPSGDPVRLGLAWRTDDAEPGSVLLVGITPGSPADRAGLKLYDRIYEVGGKRFTSGDEFRQLTASLPSPLELLAETGGKLHTVTCNRLEIITGESTAETAPCGPRIIFRSRIALNPTAIPLVCRKISPTTLHFGSSRC